jgi:hypothetical protein
MITAVVPSRALAAVGSSVCGGDRAAAARRRYVAFDLLAAGDAGDIQHAPWLRRTGCWSSTFPPTSGCG